MRNLCCSIALLLILGFVSLSLAQPADTPALVVELCRHGARAPLKDTYAKDWNEDQLGQLTEVGAKQHFLLGKALDNDYPSILGQPYDSSKIYVRSSTLNRSINSVTYQLNAVYGGALPALNKSDNYNITLAFPPYDVNEITNLNNNLNLTNAQAIPGNNTNIPIDTTSDEVLKTLLEPTQVCFPLVNDIVENIISDTAFNFWNDIAPTRQALEKLNISVENPYSLGTFGDALICDYTDGRPLPANIDPTSEIYKNITFARNWFFVRALWGTQHQRQLLSVPLFTYILNYFDQKVAGTTNYEFMFLSTAETNLIDLLATFGIVTEQCLMDNYKAEIAGQPVPNPNCNYTEFASNIIIEFYNSNGSSSVVFKYNDVPIPLCNGQVQCDYNDFKNLVNQNTNGYSIDRYKLDCLDSTLPDILTIFSKVGDAFQNVDNGGDSQDEKDKVLHSLTGDLGSVFSDNGENDLSDDFDNAVEDVKNIFHH